MEGEKYLALGLLSAFNLGNPGSLIYRYSSNDSGFCMPGNLLLAMN